MDFWQWLSASIPAGAVLNGGGLVFLATLFATDRILTKGQHERRMADLTKAFDKLTEALTASHAASIAEITKHHAAILVEKEARYTELQQSRDTYLAGQEQERLRADKLAHELSTGLNEFGQLTTHLLQSFNEAAKDVTP